MLRRRTRHMMRSDSFFDRQAEAMLRKVRAWSETKHISVVVGNPCFGTMGGWSHGGAPWKRLVYALSKCISRRVSQGEKWTLVSVNESWTTKRCPCCRIEGDFTSQAGVDDWMASGMFNPVGNQRFHSSNGTVDRVRVRGLICCKECGVQWARDFSAAINIGYVFAHALHLQTSERPRYLCGW